MSSLKNELKAHMKAAEAYAELSYAKRLKVAALLVRDGRVISIGRNGMPSGGSNVCEEYIQEGPTAELVTKKDVIHAEMNAVSFAAKSGVATEGCTMIVTHSPCFECSKLIIQSGITSIYYKQEYRLTDSLKFLRDNNVKVEKLSE